MIPFDPATDVPVVPSLFEGHAVQELPSPYWFHKQTDEQSLMTAFDPATDVPVVPSLFKGHAVQVVPLPY